MLCNKVDYTFYKTRLTLTIIIFVFFFAASQVDPEGKPITNQKGTGRCWIFACLNAIRIPFMRKYNIEDFEFSQAYLFFWDKVRYTGDGDENNHSFRGAKGGGGIQKYETTFFACEYISRHRFKNMKIHAQLFFSFRSKFFVQKMVTNRRKIVDTRVYD